MNRLSFRRPMRLGLPALAVVCISLTSCTSALHRAIREDDAPAVRNLLGIGADVNVREKGSTPLHAAARSNRTDVLWLLIEAGADADAVELRDGHSFARALHYAAGWGNLEAASLLIDAKADVNGGGFRGMTPLMEASRMGRLEMVRYLIRRGADVAKTDAGNRTALIWAAIPGRFHVAEALLDAGADPDAKDDTSYGAMRYAVENNRTELISTLKSYVKKNKKKPNERK